MSLSVFFLILGSVSLSALAQVCLKAGMAGARSALPAAVEPGSGALLAAALSQPGVLGGLLLYSLGAMVWLLVLARLDVSLAYPFVALGFVLVMLLGAWCFGEPLTATKLAGTALVCGGVVVLARA